MYHDQPITVNKFFVEFTGILIVKHKEGGEAVLLDRSLFIKKAPDEFCWGFGVDPSIIIDTDIARELIKWNNIVKTRVVYKKVTGRLPKLYIIEGGDKLGKTTITEAIANRFSMKLIRQPSSDNLLGFLRDVVKQNPTLGSFERQLLHTTSHIVDALTKFTKEHDIIMDRSYISSLVYGSQFGLSEFQLEMLYKIHNSVYLEACKGYDVQVALLVKPEKFAKSLERDEAQDFYESQGFDSKLDNTYKTYFSNVLPQNPHFHKNEKIKFIEIVDGIIPTLEKVIIALEI